MIVPASVRERESQRKRQRQRQGQSERDRVWQVGMGRNCTIYIYDILMADKEIKAEGFCEAFFVVSLFGLEK